MQYAQQVCSSTIFSSEDVISFMHQLEKNRMTRGQALEFLYAMQGRSPDSEAIQLFVKYIRDRYPCRQTDRSSDAVNIVGTGGGRSTFNISTTAAFVAAAAGAVVIKSGSSSYTSKCGALDLLKALGINLNISFERFESMVADIGLGFVNPAWYAPVLRRLAVAILPDKLKKVGGFVNVAGPLLSPVDVGARLIGVKSRELIDTMAAAIHGLGMGKAIVCWSDQGLDEFCSIGNNYFRHVTSNSISPLQTDIGAAAGVDQTVALEGGSPTENAAITHAILNGSIGGVKLETVLHNAAYILLLSGRADTVEHGIAQAAEAVSSGCAIDKLRKARQYSVYGKVRT